MNFVAALELPERMNDNWNSAQLEELLGTVAAEPASLPGSHDYGDIHSI